MISRDQDWVIITGGSETKIEKIIIIQNVAGNKIDNLRLSKGWKR